MKKAWVVLLMLLALCVMPCAALGDMDQVSYVADPIVIDGEMDDAWADAAVLNMGNKFGVTTSFDWSTWSTTTTLTPKADAVTDATVRTLWNGSAVYLLIEVNDTYVGANDKVMIGLDLLNDKLPLTEEDDALITVNPAAGTVTASWGGLNTPKYQRLLDGSAVKLKKDADGNTVGYVAELGFFVSDYAFEGGESLGFDISVANYGAHVYSGKDNEVVTYHTTGDISGDNKGHLYGTVTLEKPDADAWDQRPVDRSLLASRIASAEALPRGIWADESALDEALTAAKAVYENAAATREEIDTAAADLLAAIDGMRHVDRVSGHDLPDLKDTEKTDNLPDPFTFLSGEGVTSDNWEDRAEEIRAMAQYYEYGFMPDDPDEVTASYDAETGAITVNVTVGDVTRSFNANLYMPSVEGDFYEDGKIPILMNLFFGFGSANNATVSNGGYAQAAFTYTSVAADNNSHTGPFYDLYPYDAGEYADRGTLIAWAWGASRVVDALEYLNENDENLQGKLDLSRIGVTGQSRLGKASLVAGLMDERFGVTAPQESGSGGAGTYRYINYSTDEYPLQYSWASKPASGSEVLPHRPRNQGWNHNEMLYYALDERWFGEDFPDTLLGTSLPYDKNLVLSAIAPRGLYVICSNNDDANNSYGDATSYEGALPVYQALGIEDYLALDVGMSNAGHATTADQFERLVEFMNWYFYGIEMSEETKEKLSTNPFKDEGGYARYGGLDTMLENYTGFHYVVSFDGNGGEGEMEDEYVVAGESYTLPENGFTPPEYMEFDAWDMGDPGEEIEVTESIVVVAQWKEAPVTYSFTKGANASWTKSSGLPLEMTVKGAPNDLNTFSRFQGISVDGTAVAASNYTAEAGSVNLRIKAGYLQGLSAGAHTLTANFLDGTAETTITINEKPVDPDPGTGGGYDYKFSFTVVWQGSKEDSVDWTLYQPDGSALSKKFNKKTVSDTEWQFETWFADGGDYYVVETAPAGYKVRYENVGAHANETDRCYNGGRIINYQVPVTGDREDPALYLILTAAGLMGLGAVLWIGKRRREE